MSGTRVLTSASVEVASAYEAIEMCFERGWTDGLPVVPPTEPAIVRCLEAAATRGIQGVLPLHPGAERYLKEKGLIR